MRVGVVGGGMMGLVLAYRLARKGHSVTVFERDRQLGGLATYHDYGAFVWDRFYHVILPSDIHLISLLSDLGLGGKLRWSGTLTGFYVDGRVFSISTSLDFLKFPLVSLVGKVRLALTMLYCACLSDWKRLDRIPVDTWLIRMCGRATYSKLWQPLLLAKLGEHYRRVSAVFIWSYIKRLFGARHSTAQRESMACVSGGYRTVLTRLDEAIAAAGGVARTSVTVRKIGTTPDRRGVWVDHDGGPSTTLGAGPSTALAAGREHFDKVIFTSPLDVLARVAGADLVSLDGGGRVEYLGVVCGVLVTQRPIMPFYVLNIAEPRVPFTGIIGMSNVVPLEETAGRYVTFLPKYVISGDPLLRASDEQVRASFLDGLRFMFPDRDWSDIEALHVNRAFKVQPLQVLGYSTLVPAVATRHPDFYVLNTSQFVNCTLNNNEVVRAVDDFVREHAAGFSESRTGAPSPVPVFAEASLR
jgi:protoporphyrinogen oxidase